MIWKTPFKKRFKRISDIFAELEKDVIAARLKDGRVNKARKGFRGSGAIPFGYRKDGNSLSVDPIEAKWVHNIFRYAAKGYRVSRIIKILHKNNVRTRRGNSFSIQTLQYLLRNPLYYGENCFGDISNTSMHEALISKRLFNKVKNIKKHAGS